MALRLFDTKIEATDTELVGPWRSPRQMLQAQSYDSHASIHDDATAQKLGFQGGTIEGPTHFSQFVPLCVERAPTGSAPAASRRITATPCSKARRCGPSWSSLAKVRVRARSG